MGGPEKSRIPDDMPNDMPETDISQEKVISKPESTNMRMCVLQIIGIFMMVDAHAGASLLDIGGLIPYYSFHMPMFVFISGYFYSADEKESPVHFLKRKFKRLMIPYLIWNLIYGLWAAWLRSRGFGFGEPLSLYTLLAAPFTDGYQFILNHTAWFIPALFLEEIFFCLLDRYMLSRIGKAASAAVCIAAGCVGIAIGLYTDRGGCLLMLSRLLFMLPFFFAGRLYRTDLERRDTAPTWLYLSICLVTAVILTLTGNNRIYSLARCTGFPGYAVTFIITFNGIAFWLRISRILEPSARGRLIEYIGRHTYPVVMHHMPVLFIINSIYGMLAGTGKIFGNFDFNAYHNDIYYLYFPREMHQLRLVYIIAMISVPLGLYRMRCCVQTRLAHMKAAKDHREA